MVTPIYNEAAAAYSAKGFRTAAAKFEQVIDPRAMDYRRSRFEWSPRPRSDRYPKVLLSNWAVPLPMRNKDYTLRRLTPFHQAAGWPSSYGDMQYWPGPNGWECQDVTIPGPAKTSTTRTYATAAEIFGQGL